MSKINGDGFGTPGRGNRTELQQADHAEKMRLMVDGVRPVRTTEHSPAELEARTAAERDRANADKTTPEVFSKAKSSLEDRLKRARNAPQQERSKSQERER